MLAIKIMYASLKFKKFLCVASKEKALDKLEENKD